MINLKELHTDDLSMNSGKLFREQMIENFKAIEQEDYELKGLIKKATDDSMLALNRLDNIERILKKNGIEDYPE